MKKIFALLLGAVLIFSGCKDNIAVEKKSEGNLTLLFTTRARTISPFHIEQIRAYELEIVNEDGITNKESKIFEEDQILTDLSYTLSSGRYNIKLNCYSSLEVYDDPSVPKAIDRGSRFLECALRDIIITDKPVVINAVLEPVMNREFGEGSVEVILDPNGIMDVSNPCYVDFKGITAEQEAITLYMEYDPALEKYAATSDYIIPGYYYLVIKYQADGSEIYVNTGDNLVAIASGTLTYADLKCISLDGGKDNTFYASNNSNSTYSGVDYIRKGYVNSIIKYACERNAEDNGSYYTIQIEEHPVIDASVIPDAGECNVEVWTSEEIEPGNPDTAVKRKSFIYSVKNDGIAVQNLDQKNYALYAKTTDPEKKIISYTIYDGEYIDALNIESGACLVLKDIDFTYEFKNNPSASKEYKIVSSDFSLFDDDIPVLEVSGENFEFVNGISFYNPDGTENNDYGYYSEMNYNLGTKRFYMGLKENNPVYEAENQEALNAVLSRVSRRSVLISGNVTVNMEFDNPEIDIGLLKYIDNMGTSVLFKQSGITKYKWQYDNSAQKFQLSVETPDNLYLTTSDPQQLKVNLTNMDNLYGKIIFLKNNVSFETVRESGSETVQTVTIDLDDAYCYVDTSFALVNGSQEGLEFTILNGQTHASVFYSSSDSAYSYFCSPYMNVKTGEFDDYYAAPSEFTLDIYHREMRNPEDKVTGPEVYNASKNTVYIRPSVSTAGYPGEHFIIKDGELIRMGYSDMLAENPVSFTFNNPAEESETYTFMDLYLFYIDGTPAIYCAKNSLVVKRNDEFPVILAADKASETSLVAKRLDSVNMNRNVINATGSVPYNRIIDVRAEDYIFDNVGNFYAVSDNTLYKYMASSDDNVIGQDSVEQSEFGNTIYGLSYNPDINELYCLHGFAEQMQLVRIKNPDRSIEMDTIPYSLGTLTGMEEVLSYVPMAAIENKIVIASQDRKRLFYIYNDNSGPHYSEYTFPALLAEQGKANSSFGVALMKYPYDYNITDMYVYDSKIYVTVAFSSGDTDEGFISTGTLLRLSLNDNVLTYDYEYGTSGGLGIGYYDYESGNPEDDNGFPLESGTMTVIYPESEDSTEFFGPQKILGISSSKVLILDSGYYIKKQYNSSELEKISDRLTETDRVLFITRERESDELTDCSVLKLPDWDLTSAPELRGDAAEKYFMTNAH